MSTIFMFGVGGAGGVVAVSDDDGATWTDQSAALQAENNSGLGMIAAAQDGTTVIAVAENAFTCVSHDGGVTWEGMGIGGGLGTTGTLGGDYTSYWKYARAAIYVPARLTPTTGTNHWHRWLICGSYGSNASATSYQDRRPAISMCALRTSNSPINEDSIWRIVDLPTAIKNRPIQFEAMAFDPENRRLWVAGVAFDTQNFVLFYCDALEVVTGGTTLLFVDATSTLPTELRSGGNAYSISQKDLKRVHLSYSWFNKSLKLVVAGGLYAADIDNYEMVCGTAYNTHAWETMYRQHSQEIVRNYGTWWSETTPPAGSAHSPVDCGALYERGNYFTPYMDVEDFKDTNPWSTVNAMLRTNGGKFIYGGYDYAGDELRVSTSDPGMRSDAVSWSNTGLPAAGNGGYQPWFLQLKDATVSLSAGVTMPMAATTTWFAHPPEFYGVVHDEIPTIDTYWSLITTTVGYTQELADATNSTEVVAPAIAFTMTLADAIATSSTVTSAAEYLLTSMAAFGDAQTTKLTGGNAVADVLVLLDSMISLFPMDLSDSVGTSSTVLPTHRIVSVLVDAFSLLDGITDRLTAMELLADVIANACLAQFAPLEVMTDSVGLASTAAQWAQSVATIIDALVATDTATMSARFVTVCADSVVAGDTIASTLDALESVTDEVALYVTFRIGDEVYRGYALNTGNKAASEYTNFDFNSLATVGGVTMAANSTALYALTGDDDDGTAIEAVVRTGLLAVADGKIAQVVSAYVGYASDNSLVLKAIVTSPTGEKVEHWYRLAEQTADATREGRIKLGRGLKSAYWAFELVNVGGGTMTLDNIKLHRIALDRRI